ncbi:hypothetical protein LWI29_007519 [Acer saccharum]|uniref:Uncharacterized protein n=1 Tax=Acer saccharum TaxID=4024 RepID=A0AA39RTK1_ACESA|nr:hypothetical protein LWI29_007519 [Acer saccharum]
MFMGRLVLKKECPGYLLTFYMKLCFLLIPPCRENHPSISIVPNFQQINHFYSNRKAFQDHIIMFIGQKTRVIGHREDLECKLVGTNFQPSKKPACSPVLLPSRVVQALNINVHAIGLRISPPQDSKNKLKGGECIDSVKNKSGNDVSAKRCVTSQNQSSSPDIFLPKEWTY